MNDIINAISTVGFPIACCIFFLYQSSRQDQYNREQQERLRGTIEGNTKSIEALQDLVKDLAALVERRMKDDESKIDKTRKRE